jgi:small subunit ribosomal protein S10
MRGYDVGILADACSQVTDIAAITGAQVSGPVNLPTKKKIYCVLRSPHVDKDAREHFEIAGAARDRGSVSRGRR